jgi:very-short-patch-repair endonuclease
MAFLGKTTDYILHLGANEGTIDFYCHEQRLVIEIDGGVHMLEKQKESDENRTAELERFGIRVIRFTNDQVINSIDEVLHTIIRFVQNDQHP